MLFFCQDAPDKMQGDLLGFNVATQKLFHQIIAGHYMVQLALNLSSVLKSCPKPMIKDIDPMSFAKLNN